MARTKDSGNDHSFEDYFKRATCPMLILMLLDKQPLYVYKLSQELKKRSDNKYTVGYLYPVLYRLQTVGYVKEDSQEISESNRIRNYYSITDSGKEYLKKITEEYRELLKMVDVIIDSCKD